MKAPDPRPMTAVKPDEKGLKPKKRRFNLRFQRATGQLENTARVRVVRRDIARMLTIAKQKRAGDEPAVKPVVAKPEGAKPERVKPKATARRRAPVKSRSKPKTKSRAK